MTPAELKTIRESLGLSVPQLTAMLRVSERAVRFWEDGRFTIPDGVADTLGGMQRDLGRLADALIEHLRAKGGPVLHVYRSDADYHDADPNSPYPASWHRAAAARVLRALPSLRLDFAGPGNLAPVPVGVAREITADQRLQLAEVLHGVFIDDAALEDPRAFLLAEIEDCLDDVTDRPAYPELLAAVRLWSAEQCAALLRTRPAA